MMNPNLNGDVKYFTEKLLTLSTILVPLEL